MPTSTDIQSITLTMVTIYSLLSRVSNVFSHHWLQCISISFSMLTWITWQFIFPLSFQVIQVIISSFSDKIQQLYASTCCLWTLQCVWSSRTSAFSTLPSHLSLHYQITLLQVCSHDNIPSMDFSMRLECKDLSSFELSTFFIIANAFHPDLILCKISMSWLIFPVHRKTYSFTSSILYGPVVYLQNEEIYI